MKRIEADKHKEARELIVSYLREIPNDPAVKKVAEDLRKVWRIERDYHGKDLMSHLEFIDELIFEAERENDIAISFMKDGRKKEAFEHFSLAIAMNPSPRFLTNRATVLYTCGNFKECEVDCRRAIEHGNAGAKTYCVLAAAMYQIEGAKSAEDIIKEGLCVECGNPMLVNNLDAVKAGESPPPYDTDLSTLPPVEAEEKKAAEIVTDRIARIVNRTSVKTRRRLSTGEEVWRIVSACQES